ncbi:MAG: hypothetical protein H0V75_11985 [Rubrobacter sp.]|jgi:hypothetical protein|nr:hypothetical protein [Rubrobacter sp.]MBA4157965.1 hypothetical protein [Gemmatimonadota bacterium]
MACSRGKASPNRHTQLRLFASSGGFCQHPGCLRPLFLDVGTETIHIAEMAHIFAASDEGPRSTQTITEEERGRYENIVLLCPSCHTIVDKAPGAFPDQTMKQWKEQHSRRIAVTFGAVTYADRKSVSEALRPLLLENRTIFNAYGPDQEYRYDPESEKADVWRRKMLSRILPNNRKILAIIDANRVHLTGSEEQVVEEFRQHVDDLEARHVGDGIIGTGATFPPLLNQVFTNAYE